MSQALCPIPVYIVLWNTHARYVVTLLCSVLTNEGESSGLRAPCTHSCPASGQAWDCRLALRLQSPQLTSALCLSVVAVEAWDSFVYPVGRLQ